MIEHTPVPWRRLGNDIISDSHAYAGLVAAVYAGGVDNDDELEANMTLLLAAPELLEACEIGLAAVRKCNCTCAHDAEATLEAAIGLTRGES